MTYEELRLVAFACLNRILCTVSVFHTMDLELDTLKLSPLQLLKSAMCFIRRHFIDKSALFVSFERSRQWTNTAQIGVINARDLILMAAETIDLLGRLVKSIDTHQPQGQITPTINVSVDMRKQLVVLLASVLDVHIHETAIVCSVCGALLNILPSRSPHIFVSSDSTVMPSSSLHSFVPQSESERIPMQIEGPFGSFSATSRSFASDAEILRSFALERGLHWKLQYAMHIHQLSLEVQAHCSAVLSSRLCLHMPSSESNKRPRDVDIVCHSAHNTVDPKSQWQACAAESNRETVSKTPTTTTYLSERLESTHLPSAHQPSQPLQPQQPTQCLPHQA
jgi:hypothetical protein